MISNTYLVWSEEEYNYPLAFDFVPNFVSYLHDEDERIRPAIVIAPGGGYCVVSPAEGEIVALEFYHKGYNVFVHTYTTNILMAEPLKLQPLKDLSRTIRMLRKNADSLRIDPNQIAICGFSAAGHLCCSLAVHYEDIGEENELYSEFSNRPDGVILSYPVITSGEKAHRGSFLALLGADATEEELNYMSLEKQVKKTTPPIFVWQTVTDEAVPVENSYLIAQACHQMGVAYEHHVFAEGVHGLSVANEAWAKGRFDGFYTMQQTMNIIKKVKAGELEVSQELMQILTAIEATEKEEDRSSVVERKPDEAVAMWPILADYWLKRVLGR